MIFVLHQNDEWKFTQEVKLLLSYIHICLQKTLSQKGLPKEKLDSPDIVRIVTLSLPAVVSFRDLSLVQRELIDFKFWLSFLSSPLLLPK